MKSAYLFLLLTWINLVSITQNLYMLEDRIDQPSAVLMKDLLGMLGTSSSLPSLAECLGVWCMSPDFGWHCCSWLLGLDQGSVDPGLMRLLKLKTCVLVELCIFYRLNHNLHIIVY
jgi:hypothetical protein